MLLAEEDHSTYKTFSSVTLSTIDVMWADLKLNLGIHGKMQETT
jgi:hypothetical protein